MRASKFSKFLISLGLLAGCGATPDGDEEDEGRVGAQTAGVCPTSEPSLDEPCDGALACPYAACGRSNASIWSCEAGVWKQVIIPGCE